MNRKQNLEVFAKTPVRKAVLLQIVPAVASQMVTLVYNLADTYFVGMLNAPHETAAVTVAYPSFLMLTAISNLFGVGGASAIARALGRQDEEGARRIAAVSLAGGLLSALLFSAAFRLLADPVLHLCGATEATYATAYGYAKWVVILGGPFTILNTLLANLVRAEGSAGAAAFGVSFGGVLNILLDPLFVLPQFLGLGAVGAVQWSRREGGAWRAVRLLSALLTAESLLLLLSAAWRMTLYVDVYGLSFKRCMTYWGMGMMAAFLLAAAWKVRRPDFRFCRVVFPLALAGWLVINCVPVDYLVAKDQVDRYLSGESGVLDAEYLLYDLSYDTLSQLERLDGDMVCTAYGDWDAIGTARLSILLEQRRQEARTDCADWRTWSLSAWLASRGGA